MLKRRAENWFFETPVRPQRLFFMLVICLVLVAINGCSLGYYAQAIGGQMQVLGRRESIDKLLRDPDTDAELKERLRRVLEIRNFASATLGLPENGSYRYYADLQRPFAVWNVFAAPELSIEPVESCFLVIGCVAYRGYFKEASAQRYAQRMAKKGNDVYVAGISAYSTLGRFNDPVFNTMIHWDEWQLAGVIFHELAHQWLYVKSDSAFSEAFATVVEEYAVTTWLQSRQSSSELADYHERHASRAIFARITGAARADLKILYAADDTEAHKRMGKNRIIAETGAGQHGVASATAAWNSPAPPALAPDGGLPATARARAKTPIRRNPAISILGMLGTVVIMIYSKNSICYPFWSVRI
ncbi:MAG: aminopeptidase [Proteobacteria bacterium]|nr:aminopeptidase [Pseudomonadota bacterium]